MARASAQTAGAGIGTHPIGLSCRTFREEPLARPVSWRSGALVAFLGSPNQMRVPETPPDLPLDCHTRAGFSLANQPA
jgi:hypothetical protein